MPTIPPKYALVVDALMSIHQRRSRRPSVREVQEIVAAYYGMSVGLLLSETRTPHYVKRRWLSMWLAKRHVAISVQRIAEVHWRNNSTVVTGMRRLNAILAEPTEDSIKDELADLERILDERFELEPINRVRGVRAPSAGGGLLHQKVGRAMS